MLPIVSSLPDGNLLDDVKKWQAGEYAKLIPIRDQYAKVRSFAVPTCENPQGAKPGQTKCPF